MKRARRSIEPNHTDLENPWKKKKTQNNAYCNEHDSFYPGDICENCESVMSASQANHVHCLTKLLHQCEHPDHKNALFYAIGHGYVHCVRLLLDFDAGEVNSIQQSGIAPLHMSAGAGHVEIMKELINKGADVNLCLETDQLTALHICASFGALECLQLLLESGVDPLAQTSDSSMNALHFAAYHGHISCIQALLDFGCDINAVSSKTHRSVLHYAMCQSQEECFEFLMARGADITLLDIDGHSALLCAPLKSSILSFKCLKHFSLSERRRWFTIAAVDAEKSQTIATSRNSCLLDFRDVFVELVHLMDETRCFERVPMVEFGFEKELGKGTGVMREWFDQFDSELIDSSIMEPSGKTKYHEFTTHIGDANEERLTQATIVGMIFALALIYGHVVPINLPPYMIKLMLDVSYDISDLESIDTELYEGKIQFLRNCSADEVAALDIYFTQAERINGSLVDIELVPNGASKQVSVFNLDEYFHALCYHKIFWSRHDVLDAFITSFHRFVPKQLVSSIFTVTEVSQILNASDTPLSVDEWEQYTAYSNCSSEQVEIKWFWEILESLSDSRRRILLSFCTGSKYLATGGFKRLADDNSPFTIQYQTKLPQGTLPTTRTCFNTLLLPRFDSKKVMQEAFEIILREQQAGVGFAFV